MVFDGFIGGAYQHHSPSVDLQECVNWYLEATNPDAKSPKILIPTPGKSLFVDVGEYPIRGVYATTTGRVFAVSGNVLYELTSGGFYFSRGNLSTTANTVYMADNGVQLMIVDGTYGYICDLNTNVLSRISDPDFPGICSHVQFVNGKFVVNKTDSSQYNLFWSDNYDGLSWNGLNVASAEGYADKLISIAKKDNQLWLFGAQSTEVFYDSGDADQPFRRIEGAFFDNGTAASNSPASTGNTVFWLGSSSAGHGIVWMADSYQPQRISTHAIEYLLENWTRTARIDDAIGYCCQHEGHVFYFLTFPTANRTLVYDKTTGYWHERAYYNNLSYQNDRDLGCCHCFAFDKNLVGSRADGKIYYLDRDAYTDYGNPIKRIRTAPHIHNENRRLFYEHFGLDTERGSGITIGQGSVPNFSLTYSNDGGYTFGNEIWRTAGRIGEYRTKIDWNNLGNARDRVFRLVYTDPTPCILIQAWLEVRASSR